MLAQFYLPEKYLPDPDRQEEFKRGQITLTGGVGKIGCAQGWIYQTWVLLRREFPDLALVHTPPRSGAMIALSNFFPDNYEPPRELFFVDVVADYVPLFRAQWHVLQNAPHARRLPRSTFIPYWPHPGLIPRDPARGERFETVYFYGDPPNLAPELREESFRKRLKDDLDLEFRIAEPAQRNDYREADCVLAIRDFQGLPHRHKPASKLYNSWLAGTPMIGGADSAFSADGETGRDHLRARSMDELWAGLRRLKEDVSFRRSIVAAGTERAKAFSREAVLAQWREFVTERVPELTEAWHKKSAVGRRLFFFGQSAAVWVDRKLRR